jgi:hypothetical protein
MESEKARKKRLAWQAEYNSRPDVIKRISKSVTARRKLEKEGKVSKGDGKDVAHVVALTDGGGNTDGNLKVESRKSNRGWRKGQSGYNVKRQK